MFHRRVGVVGFVCLAMVFCSPGIGFSDSFVAAPEIRSLKACEFGAVSGNDGPSLRESTGQIRLRQSKGDSFVSREDMETLATYERQPGAQKEEEDSASPRKAKPYQRSGDSFVSLDNMKMLENY